MASPVDTSVKHYRSDMPSAPVLNGVAGSKIAQLEACLCTGYGLKAATSLTVASGIATLTFSGGASAAWADAVILVAGASNAALNGEQKVLTASAAKVTFATAQPDGTDAGTVTFKIAPAGWEKVFSKTNVAVFRSLSPEGTKMYLRVDDTNPQFVRVVGYESMSDVDTGVGPFPTAAQRSGGGYWAKSTAANASAVAWTLASDGRFFFDCVAPGSHIGLQYQTCFMRGFGDFIPKNPAGDAYLCGLSYSDAAAPVSMAYGALAGGNGEYLIAIARGYTGLGGASLARRAPYTGSSVNWSGLDAALGAFPSAVDGSLILSRSFITEASTPRGDIPGLWYSPQTGVFAVFKMFDTLVRDGRRHITMATGVNPDSVVNAGTVGSSFIDITGPWRG